MLDAIHRLDYRHWLASQPDGPPVETFNLVSRLPFRIALLPTHQLGVLLMLYCQLGQPQDSTGPKDDRALVGVVAVQEKLNSFVIHDWVIDHLHGNTFFSSFVFSPHLASSTVATQYRILTKERKEKEKEKEEERTEYCVQEDDRPCGHLQNCCCIRQGSSTAPYRSAWFATV